VRVRAWVVGAVEDAGALRFARELAAALDAPIARRLEEVTPAHVAVGLELQGRVVAPLTVVVGGTLPRMAWRPALRGLEAVLLVAEPRDELARRLGERLLRSS
jgi:hypothetical protein